MMDIDNTSTRRAVNIFIRISFIAILFMWSFLIIKPLFMITLWGIIIAVAVYPFHKKLTKVLKGRDKRSAILIILIGLGIVIVPVILFTESTIESLENLAINFKQGGIVIPPVSEEIKGIPIIGEKITKFWGMLTGDFELLLIKIAPELQIYASKLIGIILNIGKSMVQFVLSIFIGGVFLINAEVCKRAAEKIFKILIGEFVEDFHELAAGTIKSVVQGVVVVAIIQGILAGIGMLLVGVPGAGIWGIIVMIVSIIQIPPMIILIPIAIYVYTTAGVVVGIIYLIWSIFLSFLDNILKPIFMGRGTDIPMLVILLGSIGGMLSYGIIGLFVGPVILALGYKFLVALVEKEEDKEKIKKN